MKNTGRLALLGLFAAAGVGLAVCVGTSANLPEPRHESGPVALTAALKIDAEPAKVDNHAQSTVVEAGDPPGSLPATSAATGPVAVEPNPPYAQQSPPTPGNISLPKMMEVLRKGLAGTQTVPPPPPTPTPAAPQTPAATPTAPKASVDSEGDGKLRIQFKDADLREALNFLSDQGGLNILASKSVEGKVSATLNGVDIDTALRAVLKSTGFSCRREGNFIFVGTPEDFNTMEQGLDRIGTRVYRTNYVTAAELKGLVTPLLTEKIGIVSVSSPAEAGIATNDSTAGGDKFSGSEVLVVRDYEAVLTQVDQLVAEVDVRPMQVAIEAMILSVQLNDEDKFGVNFQFLRANPDVAFGLGSPPTSLANFTLDGGLKFGFLDGNLGAFISALEQVGDTSVIANPRLLVLNKQRAEIQIGEKQGYVNQTVTETSSTSSIEFLDTGTQLRLRPFISSDGLIRMEVHPELSDGSVKLVGGFTLPNKNLTETTTNIMVRDGCTVVIGGLIHEQLANTTTQVPVLGNLPLVGFLFRQTDETVERREVIVLITPRIVYEPGTCQEGQKSACEFMRRQSTYADKMSPFGKRSIARRYYRLAETAYAAGECTKALWFAEMSVQFDPLNRAALDLRTNIWLGKPYQPAGSVAQADVALANPLESQSMPDWLINDLESAPPGQPSPLHPLDPGIPGPHRDLVRPKVLQ
jgi:type IV pilus assembly protein PilQ